MGSFARRSRFPKTLRGKTALNPRSFFAELNDEELTINGFTPYHSFRNICEIRVIRSFHKIQKFPRNLAPDFL